MCGIAGVIGPNHKQLVSRMTEILVHRGPDEDGFFHGEGVSLGQRRLSIIDLAGGRQPISNEDGSIQLVCNGEIYNSPSLRKALIGRGHRFKTATDVEVILHLYEDYGVDCVKHLRGMFAYALWDEPNQKLVLARDHLGQKPLFFAKKGDQFLFASEVKAILSADVIEPEIDLEGLWHYMSLRFVPDQYSMFKGVQKLPAATTLTFQHGETNVSEYWDIDFRKKRKGSEADIEEELDSLLRETVKLHLLSDVPVGTFLSGGIDSSTITAMAASITGQSFPTFSIGVKEQRFNELPYARMVSDQYKLDAHEEVVEANLVHLLPEMVYHMDEPADPFGVGVYLVSRIAAQHVKVVLGGDGGDENFAGYDRFAGNRLVEYYCILPRPIRKHLISRLVKLVPDSFGYKSFAQKLAWANSMSLHKGGTRYAESMSFLRFTRERKEQLFTPAAKSKIDDDSSTAKILRFFDADCVEDLVDRMLYTDLKTRMPDHLLMLGDRMTMAHSLEGRSPLIDYKVVEYAASLPADMKLKGKTLKYMLKQVARRYLSSELIDRSKQGFGFPIARWLRTDLRHFLKNLFAESRFVELGLFDPSAIQELLDEHLEGKSDHNFRLWILLNLEIWYRIHFERKSIEEMHEFIDIMRRDKVRTPSVHA